MDFILISTYQNLKKNNLTYPNNFKQPLINILFDAYKITYKMSNYKITLQS